MYIDCEPEPYPSAGSMFFADYVVKEETIMEDFNIFVQAMTRERTVIDSVRDEIVL